MSKFKPYELEQAVAKMVEVAIGDQLSTITMRIDGVDTQVPSVILARRTQPVDGKVAPAPPYPFVMIDTASFEKVHWLLKKTLVGDDNVYETSLNVRVNIKVIGTPVDSVDMIASELDQAFTVDDYQNLIETNYGASCQWQMTSDPITTATTINDIYQEACSFDAYFSVIREYVHKDVGGFSEVVLDPILESIENIKYPIPYTWASAGESFMLAGEEEAVANIGYVFSVNK